MTFALPLALLLAGCVGLVFLAHALRKGRAEPMLFPGAHLVLNKATTAKERNRLEDRFLLLLRSLMVLSLAVLAASPLVTCSRFTLTRKNGASVSLVMVLDDSASMRARDKSDTSRFEKARKAAAEVLRDAQVGDSYSVVLAGSPARILVSPTTDPSSISDALDAISVTDRGTDLEGALALARGLQAGAEQSEKPILLLSDLSDEEAELLDADQVIAPELGLTEPLRNCAITSAQLLSQSVVVEVSCTDAAALEDRTLVLLDKDDQPVSKEVPAKDGVTVIALLDAPEEKKSSLPRSVRLSEKDIEQDQIPEDDTTFVLRAATELAVAVRADVHKAGVKTGTDTVLQSGLEALKRGVRVEPLSLLPDDEAGLSRFAAVFIDDPSGFPPEVRGALQAWLEKGGVAAVFLGPGIERAPLGSNFHPFVDAPPRWIRTDASGTDPNVPGPIGPLSTTWADLGASFRAYVQPPSDAQTLSEWSDGAPLIFARPVGQGLCLTVTLPVSVDRSDFALRPAYLEFLDYVLTQTSLRTGATALPVGQSFRVPENARIRGPQGQELEPQILAQPDAEEKSISYAILPDLAGPYLVTQKGQTTERFALPVAPEHVSQPHPLPQMEAESVAQNGQSYVGISRQVALFVLLLTFAELAFRVLGAGKTRLTGAVGLPERDSSAKVPSP